MYVTYAGFGWPGGTDTTVISRSSRGAEERHRGRQISCTVLPPAANPHAYFSHR